MTETTLSLNINPNINNKNSYCFTLFKLEIKVLTYSKLSIARLTTFLGNLLPSKIIDCRHIAMYCLQALLLVI